MKLLHIVHAVITALLLLGATIFGLLVLARQVEVRFPPKASDNGHSPNEFAVKGQLPLAGSKARLVVIRGLKPGVEFQLFEGLNYIGRADQHPVDVDIQDQEPQDRIWSSRQHALITCENDSLAIEDLNSANGTYVNRNRVPPGQQLALKANDVIQIGTVQLQFRQ
jgi:hypothetical protein